MRKTLLKGGGAAAAVVTAMMIGGLIPSSGVNAAGEPADKASIAGSTVKEISPGKDVELLKEKIRTSNTADLILQVTMECSIMTDVVTTGDDDDRAEGSVVVWVSIDNSPWTTAVPVAGDDGKVTFCNRMHQQIFTGDDDLETYLRTKEANGFNWMAMNVGSGIHTVRVMASLEGTPDCVDDDPPQSLTTMPEEATGTTCAKALVGKRTLIVEPTKAANGETPTDI